MYENRKFQEMLAETKGEGDRGCALILAANLDNRLRELLIAHFVSMPCKQQKALFEGTGPLSTFSSRISVSYACGLLAEDEAHDLQLIRKIRNLFAHEEHGWSFVTPSISNRCDSLKMPLLVKREYPELADKLAKSRSIFQITAASLTLLLAERAKSALSEKRTTHALTSILPRRGGAQP
ncbi:MULTISPECIES: MltR family transcriptional regulator [Halomonadaceae]|uniref:MltR family transcriptional regulator n=1 Tax=Halomonadaceae TaxID=28256 RepID=UPI001582C0E6|nr:MULTISPECIES: MltR family transcriptional regulator [Halomonas]MDI4639166.1 MltR family transcriptional regulator [Halomonas sp. BMC7]NUJ60156.1 hypothetical protein [Halomonas taeanensis]